MSADPFPTPSRHRVRGTFPAHSDRPLRQLTAKQAARQARARLERWRRENRG